MTVTHWLFAMRDPTWAVEDVVVAASMRFDLSVARSREQLQRFPPPSPQEMARRMWLGYFGLSMPGHE